MGAKLGLTLREEHTLRLEFVVFWVVVPCSVVVGYQHFRGLCCLPLQGWSAWWMESGNRYKQDI